MPRVVSRHRIIVCLLFLVSLLPRAVGPEAELGVGDPRLSSTLRFPSASQRRSRRGERAAWGGRDAWPSTARSRDGHGRHVGVQREGPHGRAFRDSSDRGCARTTF
jgi:hypothetical protein